MKTLLIPTTLAIALGSAGLAFAADEPSGRPTAVLDQKECQNVWKAESDGSALKAGRAEEIVNFPQADKDNDGKITQAEFNSACKLGLVNNAALEQQPRSKTE